MTQVLDKRLEQESVPLVETDFAMVRLRNERRWPWCLVVPYTDEAEFHRLDRENRHQLNDLVCAVSSALMRYPRVAKINIASLGNVVSQQHWHIIGRWPGDPEWPNSVIGTRTDPLNQPEALARAATIAELIDRHQI